MTRRILLALLLVVLVATAGVAADGDTEGDQPTLGKALKEGDFFVSLRYRLESVDEANPAFMGKDGNASTLRTTLGYRSASWQGLRAMIEFEDVTDLGLGDDHRNAGADELSNGVTGRPTVADPEITEINQATLSYVAPSDVKLAVGRQEILLGNLRYVGNVGWRQNHQSLDSFRLDTGVIPQTKLTYAYLWNVNRIFGDNKELDGHLLQADVSIGSGHLMPYVFSLDYERMEDRGASTTTFGASWSNSFEAGERWSIPYHVEYAVQSDAGDNPNNVDAHYYHVMVSGKHPKVTIGLGLETLEGSVENGSFQTPLATLHAWNGWADKFLSTPATGLEDTYLSVSGKCGALGWKAVYHDFSSDTENLDYGTELDGQLVYKAPWGQVFGLKAALYSGDAESGSLSIDTDKLWFWTGYAF